MLFWYSFAWLAAGTLLGRWVGAAGARYLPPHHQSHIQFTPSVYPLTPLVPQLKNQYPRYEVFTCFLGKGDKETFAYAMAAVKEAYHVVPSPPGSLGTTGE